MLHIALTKGPSVTKGDPDASVALKFERLVQAIHTKYDSTFSYLLRMARVKCT